VKKWLQKIWRNKFMRDRIIWFFFLVTMFVGFWQAYHAVSDLEKLPGLVAGVISLMVVLCCVFQDFDPKDPGGGGR
jgi:hypothetical protein